MEGQAGHSSSGEKNDQKMKPTENENTDKRRNVTQTCYIILTIKKKRTGGGPGWALIIWEGK